MLEMRQISFLMICVIVVGIPLVQALSTNVPGRYIIQMGNDQTINHAIDTIQEEVPDISTISYGSLKYHLLLHRIMEPLV